MSSDWGGSWTLNQSRPALPALQLSLSPMGDCPWRRQSAPTSSSSHSRSTLAATQHRCRQGLRRRHAEPAPENVCAGPMSKKA